MKRVLVTAAVLLLPALARGADLRVVGTDLLGLEFTKGFYEYAGRAALHVTLALDGSRPGLARFRSGEAELALVLGADGEESALASDGAVAVTFGYECVCVLAPPKCPLERISLEELAAIFGASAPRTIVRWGELGAAGAWAESRILACAPESGRGIVLDFFRHAVLRDGPLRVSVVRCDDRDDALDRLGGDSRALVLAATAPPPARARLLALAAHKSGPAFRPTPASVHAGDYPLRLVLRAVYRAGAASRIRPLLRFLFSERAAELLAGAAAVPLPPEVRAEQRIALEKSGAEKSGKSY